MPSFKYQAVTPEGVRISGVLEAPTTVGAESALAEREFRVLKVKERKSLLQLELTKKKVPRQEVMNFSRQLAAFVRAGIPILHAISTISDEMDNKAFRRALLEVGDALRRGDTFSGAVSLQDHVFPGFYVDMLRSAELTGRLDTVLNQLAQYIERDLDARRKIRSALAYPAVIGVMSLVTIAILTAFVLPRFKRFFQSLDAQLPLPTRMLLAATDFLMTNWHFLLGGTVLVLVLGTAVSRTRRGRYFKDRLILRIPVIREVVRYAIVERFCRILSSMVAAGVALPQAMTVVGDGTKNMIYQDALARVRGEMLEGEGLASPMIRTGLFPPAVTQMVKAGESTGTLDEQLKTAAEFYAQELDYKIKKLTTLFEPAMIVVMGLLVGFVAIALVSAMYGIFNQVKSI